MGAQTSGCPALYTNYPSTDEPWQGGIRASNMGECGNGNSISSSACTTAITNACDQIQGSTDLLGPTRHASRAFRPINTSTSITRTGTSRSCRSSARRTSPRSPLRAEPERASEGRPVHPECEPGDRLGLAEQKLHEHAGLLQAELRLGRQDVEHEGRLRRNVHLRRPGQSDHRLTASRPRLPARLRTECSARCPTFYRTPVARFASGSNRRRRSDRLTGAGARPPPPRGGVVRSPPTRCTRR